MKILSIFALSGVLAACAPMYPGQEVGPHDGGRPVSRAPAPHAVDPDEYLDVRTGLIWRRCAFGTQWDGKTCIGRPRGDTYNGAVAYAIEEARRTGRYWRLPRIHELKELYATTRDSRAIFPRMPGPMDYWSIDKSTGWYAYYINFYDPPDGKQIQAAYMNETHGIMLVRSR